jgi:hypothetical protein
MTVSADVGEALHPYPSASFLPGPVSVDFDCHIQLNPTLKSISKVQEKTPIPQLIAFSS